MAAGFARFAAALLALWLACAGAWAAGAPAGRGPQHVSVQLNWKHQFQFAGFYAAIERGYYRDAGLEVQLIEASEGSDPIDAVLSGAAQFGVGASELALRRARGEPVVALATILQHSPLVLLARRGVADNVQQLAGRRVMIMPHETELYAYLRREGLGLERIVPVPHSFDPRDLIEGHVDAVSGYVTDEPFQLRQARMNYIALTPRTAGIDFYADTLFTTQAEVRRDRSRVSAFLEATLRGWRYAMDYPAEVSDLILRKYSQRHTREHLLFEAAEMRRLMLPELIPIGYMNPGRWKHIADVYAELGMLTTEPSLDGFLFDPDPRHNLAWLYRWIALGAVALVLAAAVAARERRRNRALRQEIARRSAAEQELVAANAELETQLGNVRRLQQRLEDQALRDSLTGLYNRRYLDATLERELARAQRDGQPLSIVMLDVDHFKRLNDTYGHQAGDAVLCSLATLLTANVRTGDLACRWGGEEFVLLFPGMALELAAQRAEDLREEFARTPMAFEALELHATVSAGVAAWPAHGQNATALLAAADAALYRAKMAGRNRVEIAGAETTVS